MSRNQLHRLISVIIVGLALVAIAAGLSGLHAPVWGIRAGSEVGTFGSWIEYLLTDGSLRFRVLARVHGWEGWHEEPDGIVVVRIPVGKARNPDHRERSCLWP